MTINSASRVQDCSISADDFRDHLRVAQQKQDDPIARIIKNSIEASCTINVSMSTPSGLVSTWSGSGFHLGNGMVATASHVVPPSAARKAQITLMFDPQHVYEATLAISDPSVDAAILQCDEAIRTITSVALANSDNAEVGDIVAVIGSPEGWHDTATVGRISNVHQTLGDMAPSDAWKDIIFIDAQILEGVSGGMVIGTDGLVYGLVMGVAGKSRPDLGIGEQSVCPSNKIRGLLNQVLSGP